MFLSNRFKYNIVDNAVQTHSLAACQFALQLSRYDWNWEQTCALPELIKTPPWLDGQIIPAGLVLLLTCEQGRARVTICPRRGRARRRARGNRLYQGGTRALRSHRAQLEKCCWTWAMRATRGERSVQRRWMHVEAQLQIHSLLLEESQHWQRKRSEGREGTPRKTATLGENYVSTACSLQNKTKKDRIEGGERKKDERVDFSCSESALEEKNECQRREPA